MNLTTETILITGGTSGIGLEMAKQLIALGNTVIVTGRDRAKLVATQKQLPTVHTYQSDVSDPAAIQALYTQVTTDFPSLNVLINNAGVMRTVDFTDTNYDQITREIEVDLNGPIRMSQRFLAHLLTRPQSAIVNMTSGLAYIDFPQTPIYGAAKSGLHAYTKALRQQLRASSVQVFELAPPKTSAPMLHVDQAGAKRRNLFPTMSIAKVVAKGIRGIQTNKYEIKPGMSKLLKLMGRLTF